MALSTQTDNDSDVRAAEHDQPERHGGQGAAERLHIDGEWRQTRTEPVRAHHRECESDDSSEQPGHGTGDKNRARHARTGSR